MKVSHVKILLSLYRITQGKINKNSFSRRYVGVCCGIKVVSCLIFLLDYWLIRKRQNAEKKQAHLTMGEVVNSIISLDKRKLKNEIYISRLF